MFMKSPFPRQDPLTGPIDVDSAKIAADALRYAKDLTKWTTGKFPDDHMVHNWAQLDDGYRLKFAHFGERLFPHEAYASPAPIPKPPIGKVPYEGFRQLLTFLVPLIVLVLSYFFLNRWMGVAVVAVPAYLIGMMLDKDLQRAIAKLKQKEAAEDEGRFDAVRKLSFRLNLAPEEITLQRMMAMYSQYTRYYCRSMEDWNKYYSSEALKRHAESQIKRMRQPRRGLQDTATGTAGWAGTAAGLAAAAALDGPVTQNPLDSYPLGHVNPTTGLPMLPDGVLDAGGHVFGAMDDISMPSFEPDFEPELPSFSNDPIGGGTGSFEIGGGSFGGGGFDNFGS